MTSRDAHIRRYVLLTHQVVMKTRNTSETLLENSPSSCYQEMFGSQEPETFLL